MAQAASACSSLVGGDPAGAADSCEEEVDGVEEEVFASDPLDARAFSAADDDVEDEVEDEVELCFCFFAFPFFTKLQRGMCQQ